MITNTQHCVGPTTHPRAGVNLDRADIRGIDARDTVLDWISIIEADATKAKLTRSSCDGINAQSATLNGANLDYVRARRGSFEDSKCGWTSFVGADLERSDFNRAFLHHANFRNANLREVDFSFADISGAELGGADFTGVDFTGAKLDKTDLSRANLQEIRKDFFKIMGCADNGMIMMLRAALTLEDNNVVTIPDFGAAPWRPAERFFLAIRKGLPRGNQPAAIAVQWIDEFFIGGQPRGS